MIKHDTIVLDMAFSINRQVEWQAGVGTPSKYGVGVNATCDLVSVVGSTATFRLVGTITVINNPTNSQNSFPASDIAVLSPSDYDPRSYSFSAGTSYYQQPLPFLPNAPQSYVDAMLFEFRGDTERPNPNRSSLYIKGQGVVLNSGSSQFTNAYNINTTFQLPLSGSPTQEVLIWNSSGAGSTTEYGWSQRQVWATMLDFDYRPGAIWNGTAWVSHNRDGGARDIYNGSSWVTLRTIDGGSGTGNPPSIYNGNNWSNQRRVGQGG